MNTYVWSIKNIKCRPLIDDRRDVVSLVFWELTAISNQTKKVQGEIEIIDTPYTAKTSGETLINYQETENFIPYEQLSESAIVEWLVESLNAEKISELKKQLDNEILKDIKLPIVSKPLPWLLALETGE